MAQPIANVVLSTDLFSTWLTRTNQIAAAISSSVVTANSTLGSTTGNAHIEGALSANTLVASSFLRGGNNSTSNTLVITSNVTANAYLSIANTLTVTGKGALLHGLVELTFTKKNEYTPGVTIGIPPKKSKVVPVPCDVTKVLNVVSAYQFTKKEEEFKYGFANSPTHKF